MKIIVLSSHTPSLFWFRIDMMRFFQKEGHMVIAAGPGVLNEWEKKFLQYNIKYYQIHVARNGVNPLDDIRTLLSLYRFIKNEKPDKIFVYQAKTISYGCIAAKLNGITEVYPMVAGLGSIFRGKGLKNSLVKHVMRKLYKNAFHFSAKVFFQNQDDRNEIIELGLLDENKAVMVNGSGVNLERFIPFPLPVIPTFLFIGRLIKDKGVLEYLKACEKVKNEYPNIRCLVVGPYDSNPSALKSDELDEYIRDGIIEYFGEQIDVRPYIAQCSVFILPSYYEGTPKTVLESMAMGRAIITTDAPGCRETVVNGKNGFLVPVKNVKSIVEKMVYFIENPNVIVEMGKQGRMLVEDKFDVNKVNKVIAENMGII